MTLIKLTLIKLFFNIYNYIFINKKYKIKFTELTRLELILATIKKWCFSYLNYNSKNIKIFLIYFTQSLKNRLPFITTVS